MNSRISGFRLFQLCFQRKLFLVLLLLPGLAYSQILLTNTDNRHGTSLGGTWSYIVDPYATGYYNYRLEPYDQLTGDGHEPD